MAVIDASVAYKWWDLKEEQSNLAKKILKDHSQDRQKIVVPNLIFYELSNAWATKSRFSLLKIKANLNDLESLDLEIADISINLIEKAVFFSRKYKVSVYDAIYAVLARAKKCNLITADDKFVDQVKLPFVNKLSSLS